MSIFLFHAMRSSYLYLSPCSSSLSGHPSSSFWGLLQAYVSFRTQQKRIMTWYTLLVRPTSGIKHVQLRCREWSEPVTDGGIFSGDFGDVLMCRKIREYPDSWPLATREINDKMHWVLGFPYVETKQQMCFWESVGQCGPSIGKTKLW